MGKFGSVIKKMAVILIASLMVLGLVPIGILTIRPHTASAEGEFLRISPTAEVTVTAKHESVTDDAETDGTEVSGLAVGGSAETYLRFDLQSLRNNKEMAEIQKATLRLTALQTDGKAGTVRLRLMRNADWEKEMTWEEKPSDLDEIYLADLWADTEDSEAKAVEVDLTAYLKKWLKDKETQVALHLDVMDDAEGLFAGTACEDPLWRPCLKVVTGDAHDPDSADIEKTYSARSTKVGGERDLYRVGNGQEAYLQFGLTPENIQGVIEKAYLCLGMKAMDAEAEVFVYQLVNGQWDDRAALPSGEEVLLCHLEELSAKSLKEIDLTHAVNDAYARGETLLTLKICGAETAEVSFAESGEKQPRLALKVSDDAQKTAAVQAAVYALNDYSADAVAGNLRNRYTTENGTDAEIRWVCDSERIKENGTVVRPSWFADAEQVTATAVITSGDYTVEREYLLTVLPEEIPDLTGKKADHYLRLGSHAEETAHAFGEANTAEHGRWIGTRYFSYRSLGADGTMAVNLAVLPEKQNFLSVKVWKEQIPTAELRVESLNDRSLEAMLCGFPEGFEDEDGFLYLTYPIPDEMCAGREVISLRLSCGEHLASDEESEVPWELYGVYTTTTPYFDPLEFAEQGETFAGKNTEGVSAVFRRFLERMRSAADDLGEEEVLLSEEYGVGVEDSAEGAVPMLAFEDGGDRIAVFLAEGQKVKIHRVTPSYDAYAETKQSRTDNDLTAIDYGTYRIFRNHTRRSRTIPWEAEGMAGIYQDLVSRTYWACLTNGQMTDDSVLPSETVLHDAKEMVVEPSETVVMKHLAEPLETPEWRVSAINGQSVSEIRAGSALEITRVTVKNTGQKEEEAESLQVICAVYEKGMLAGLRRQTVPMILGRGEYRVSVDPLRVASGQTLKIFIEPTSAKMQALTPKLELK